jgi:predicted porin
MKKTLLALAALSAFAGAASAQSSVTLFGLVDVTARYVSNTDTMYMLATDGQNSSRLGFRGVEDLGGGLKAGFWLEGSVQADNGNSAAGQNWQRRSTVSLMGNWGEIRMGRDYTPQFWNWTVFDPFGTNGVGSSLNLGLEANRTIIGGTYGTLVRANNTVGYFLPEMGGLYGQVMMAAGEGTPGNKHAGGRIGYAAGPFNFAAAYGKTQVNTADDKGDEWNVGGSWAFGPVKISGYYGEIDVINVTQKNWYVGGQWQTGAWNWKASYGAVDNNIVRQTNGQGANQWAIGTVYSLSKRTSLYGTYSSISNDSAAAFRVSTGPALKDGDTSSGFDFGISHAF